MTTCNENLSINVNEQADVQYPRICVIMPRFYPLYSGHSIQMMKFLPRLIQMGLEPFVITGMIEGDPKTNSVRDLLRGWRGERQNVRWLPNLIRVVQSFIRSIHLTITYIRLHPQCFRQPSVTVDGVDIYRLPTWGPIHTIRKRFFSLSAAYYLIANRDQYDIIHLVGTGWHISVSILLSKVLKKKVVVEMVLLGADDPETIARKRFGKLNLIIWKQADYIASLSTALTESCLRMEMDSRKIIRIPVGVDIQIFCPIPDQESKMILRDKWKLPLEGGIVIFVGGIKKRKGIDLLIEAWSLIIKEKPNAYLVCVGPIGYTASARDFFEEQKQKIEMLNLQSKIIFTGRIDSVHEYLQAGDIFVLPSINEGLPNSVLEAMACGLPPVTSNIPGISQDIIRSAEEGMIVLDRTPEAFAVAILNLLESGTKRKAIGIAARGRIINCFSLTSRAQQYRDLYYSLLISQ